MWNTVVVNYLNVCLRWSRVLAVFTLCVRGVAWSGVCLRLCVCVKTTKLFCPANVTFRIRLLYAQKSFFLKSHVFSARYTTLNMVMPVKRRPFYYEKGVRTRGVSPLVMVTIYFQTISSSLSELLGNSLVRADRRWQNIDVTQCENQSNLSDCAPATKLQHDVGHYLRHCSWDFEDLSPSQIRECLPDSMCR